MQYSVKVQLLLSQRIAVYNSEKSHFVSRQYPKLGEWKSTGIGSLSSGSKDKCRSFGINWEKTASLVCFWNCSRAGLTRRRRMGMERCWSSWNSWLLVAGQPGNGRAPVMIMFRPDHRSSCFSTCCCCLLTTSTWSPTVYFTQYSSLYLVIVPWYMWQVPQLGKLGIVSHRPYTNVKE